MAFAISGTAAAAKKNMDLLSVVILAVITVAGGDVFRDSLMGETPPAMFRKSIFTIDGLNIDLRSADAANGFFAVFLAVTTGAGDGVMRNVLAEEMPVVLTRYIHADASIAGARAAHCLLTVTVITVSDIISFVTVIVIRTLAIRFRWNLPRIHDEKNVFRRSK